MITTKKELRDETYSWAKRWLGCDFTEADEVEERIFGFLQIICLSKSIIGTPTKKKFLKNLSNSCYLTIPDATNYFEKVLVRVR